MGTSASRTVAPPPPSDNSLRSAEHATSNTNSNSPSTSNFTMQTPSSESTKTSESAPTVIHGYTFPQDKLKRRLQKPGQTPLVLVACGSFSPITILHLQLFELAERYVERSDKFEIVGCYVSPCSDTYGKSSLVASSHRINMCKLAIEENGSNIMIDEWEAVRKDSDGSPVYTPTSDVLRRLDDQLNNVLGGIETADGSSTVKAKVMLLMGADLAQTMSDPNIWAPADIDVLLGYYGGFIVERPDQCDINKAIEPLRKHQPPYNIFVVPSFPNDVSSTKIRAQLRNGERALDLPESVFDYIQKHGLYRDS
ncbi:nicotinamide mononucleotide adenylyltransferase [Geosmithia morbida]|uniref:Nicotinamide-nucleotide adenylyltransferase n=1 Tax=Geosmithia morbida TaxID=1094350 RepID=A0A9P5D2R1_9HYPO|nr:nicotinamide mononucleotide adenylyltransferase [Geosmithia morbida]KAF4125358.1 nicotinamide mononucleotide adenylyltransferase [Geosmithia morbida]